MTTKPLQPYLLTCRLTHPPSLFRDLEMTTTTPSWSTRVTTEFRTGDPVEAKEHLTTHRTAHRPHKESRLPASVGGSYGVRNSISGSETGALVGTPRGRRP